VIGLGYVGLPLALLFAEKGIDVTGIDVDDQKIQKLQQGKSYIEDIETTSLHQVLAAKKFTVSGDYSVIKDLNVIIICVPTPITEKGTPDLRYLESAAEQLVPNLRKNQLVVLESSTYPGTTTSFLQPILEKSGLTVGDNLFLGYSPERIDPGNKLFRIDEIPKIVSGVTKTCGQYLDKVYRQVFKQVVLVSRPEIAEMTKLLENSYRLINISFINEFAMICDKLGVDIWEVIAAASTKPYGYQPFYPGPGIGGHCIPVDPLYLAWYAKQHGTDFQFLKLGHEINREVPHYVTRKIAALLEDGGIDIHHAKILICGVAYKKEISDTRETAALPVIGSLLKMGAQVSYHDPYVPEFTAGDIKMRSVPLNKDTLSQADCVVLLTDHSSMDIEQIMNYAKLVYDTRNMSKDSQGSAKIVRMGGGEAGTT
jgi:UDP-N-acetyl-D-glucosamine dehydrogenase